MEPVLKDMASAAFVSILKHSFDVLVSVRFVIFQSKLDAEPHLLKTQLTLKSPMPDLAVAMLKSARQAKKYARYSALFCSSKVCGSSCKPR